MPHIADAPESPPGAVLSAGHAHTEPFRHVTYGRCLPEAHESALLAHFTAHPSWELRAIKDFYETYDLGRVDWNLPPEFAYYGSPEFAELLGAEIERRFDTALKPNVDITAQKMIAGQRIGIHTDFGPVRQAYRFLIQLNAGWPASNGGLLFLLDEEKPTSPSPATRVFVPSSGSGLAFEISERSFHGVSRVEAGERYTLAYSFYAR